MQLAGWQFTPFILPIMAAAVLSAGLAIYAWRQREDAPGTMIFVGLVALIAWWSFTYALELATTDAATMLLWVKLEWVSIALLGVALFLFTLIYTGRTRHVTLRNAALLVIVPLIAIDPDPRLRPLKRRIGVYALIYTALALAGQWLIPSAEWRFVYHIGLVVLGYLGLLAGCVAGYWRAAGKQPAMTPPVG